MFILKGRRVTLFKRSLVSVTVIIGLFAICFCVGCSNPIDGDVATSGKFTFCVADVGQGLAQFGVMGKRAVVWDMGAPNQYAAWFGAYKSLGEPQIESIVISHFDSDHYGGLESIGRNVHWDGTIVVSPYEDTAAIRRTVADYWRDRLKFSFCVGGDTLKLIGGVDIICMWPPPNANLELPLDGKMRNRYSLVFSVRHGYARALITSDIDSVAMKIIAVNSGYDLRAQILSVPHHGSAGSVNSLFFSYISAEIAVISCSGQEYGHPSPEMESQLVNLGIKIAYTHLDNTITFVSNGYYW